MREILFRGRRIDNGEWVYGYYVATKDSHFICYDNQYDDDLFLSPTNIMIEVDPETVGQFTGFRDNKRTAEYPEGQMIFEGDLISDGYNNIGIVEWISGDNPGFYLHWTNIETGGFDGINEWGTVIGNIFKNPELLEV